MAHWQLIYLLNMVIFHVSHSQMVDYNDFTATSMDSFSKRVDSPKTGEFFRLVKYPTQPWHRLRKYVAKFEWNYVPLPQKNIKKIAGLDILILGRLLLTCPEFSGIFGNDPLAKYPKKKTNPQQPPATLRLAPIRWSIQMDL